MTSQNVKTKNSHRHLSLYAAISQKLISNVDRSVAQKDKVFHKYDGHRALGIRSKILSEILQGFRREISNLDRQEAFDLALDLYKKEIEEFALAGNFVLQKRIAHNKIARNKITNLAPRDNLKSDDLIMLDKILDHFHSWSVTDDFCIDVLQPLLFKYPKQIIGLLKKWNRSKNMWKRRASVVAFTRKAGESGKFTNIALSLCTDLLNDHQDLVLKGVGWCLKDIMRGNRKKVFAYVKKIKKDCAASVITLYAIRDIKGKERANFLKK